MRTLLAVAALAVSGTALAKDEPVFDPDAEPATIAQTFLEIDNAKALAGLRRVAIPCFRVEFATENSAKAQSSGTMGATAVKADIKLTGVTDETRQAITNRLYDQLVGALTAAGLEVVPYDTLKDDPQYKSLGNRLLATPHPVGTQLGKSVFVGPMGAPTYTSNDDKHLGLGAQLGGFGPQTQNIEPQIARSLDAAVLRVTMAVQFAEQKKSGGMFRNQSSVESGIRLAYVPELTQVLVVTPGSGKARITLDKLVPIEDPVVTIKDTETKGEKTAEAIGNAITGLMTGITRQTAKLEAVADPAVYEQGVGRYGAALERAMVHAIHPPGT
jgi:hypothetical protein